MRKLQLQKHKTQARTRTPGACTKALFMIPHCLSMHPGGTALALYLSQAAQQKSDYNALVHWVRVQTPPPKFLCPAWALCNSNTQENEDHLL